jgi:hypothetical protein
MTTKMPFNERVNAISINPDMATRDDIAEMAADLSDFNRLKLSIIATLDWMIAHFDFMNEQTGLEAEDSPELKEAKDLLAELKK